MPAISAALSSITYNSIVLDAVGTYSISASRGSLETTQVGSQNAYFIPGVSASIIALDLYYNKANHAVLTTSYLAGATNAFTITAESGDVITGSAFVMGCDIIASNSDLVRGSVTLQVTGPISINSVAVTSGVNEA